MKLAVHFVCLIILKVRVLVKEVEELKGGRVVREDDLEVSSSEVSSSSRIITDRLVTFRYVCTLSGST